MRVADEAVCIGPAASKESYLRVDKIIAACKQTGAEAVHPGYGFLSENQEFSRTSGRKRHRLHRPEALLGRGDGRQDRVQEAGASKPRSTPFPATTMPSTTPEQAVEIAKGIGYPVMIKASAGGGGKGLRVAFNDQEASRRLRFVQNRGAGTPSATIACSSRSLSKEPHHIEIQVLGDAHGNSVYLHERECSIQRRHQKVIEEAPSPFIDDATRKAMGEQAVALAKAVNYQTAGTVEFVVGGKDKSFYFLEMNTRLQVEHPVTECITGLDLVELMIRVAAGEKLPFTQKDIKPNGWAMECRINAEDPFRGFLPSTGRLVKFGRRPTWKDRCRSRQRARRYRRLRRWRDLDVLRFDDRQADRAWRHPRRRPSSACATR